MRVAAAALILLTAAIARAGGGPATDAYDGIEGDGHEAHALVDLYLQHRLGGAGAIRLRAFDPADGPSIGLLRVTLAHRPRTLGYRIDLGVGDLANGYAADDPLSATRPELAGWLARVQQAFVTAVVPVGRGLAIDVGKFQTPIGLEDNEAITNWSYSRSLLFTWAEPSVHSGARATYELPHGVALSAFWLDGWNGSFLGGNGMRSFALAARWQRDRLELTLVYAGGLERAPAQLQDPTLAYRNLIDFYLRGAATAWLTLALTADFGHDQARGGRDFGGVALYASAEATRRLRATVRAELLADPRGFATGTAQTVGEVTLTVELHGELRRFLFSLRAEYRHDQSSAGAFGSASDPRKSQDTLTVALIAAR